MARERRAEYLLAAIERRDLKLLNEEGIPIWRRGQSATTIDLGFASSRIAAQVIRFQLQED